MKILKNTHWFAFYCIPVGVTGQG